MKKVRPILSLSSMALIAITSLSFAQNYPSKPIRIVTAAAGGGSDFTSRLIGQGISGPLGQQVIVDNRGGVTVSGGVVARAPPDGYTLLVTGSSFWVVPLLQKMPYDVANDFSPISLLVREVLVLAVHPSLPVKSVKDLIALAKARPSELNYSQGATGGPSHLGAELFKSMAGVNIVNVAYNGIARSITGAIGGEVQLVITDAGLLAPHVKSGRLRALAVTSAEPSALAPGLPTVAASGVAGYEAVSMAGIFAPAKTPSTIIDQLNLEIVRVVRRADVKERFLSAGSEVIGNSPEEFAAMLQSEVSKWGKVIKNAGIKAE